MNVFTRTLFGSMKVRAALGGGVVAASTILMFNKEAESGSSSSGNKWKLEFPEQAKNDVLLARKVLLEILKQNTGYMRMASQNRCRLALRLVRKNSCKNPRNDWNPQTLNMGENLPSILGNFGRQKYSEKFPLHVFRFLTWNRDTKEGGRNEKNLESPTFYNSKFQLRQNQCCCCMGLL